MESKTYYRIESFMMSRTKKHIEKGHFGRREDILLERDIHNESLKDLLKDAMKFCNSKILSFNDGIISFNTLETIDRKSPSHCEFKRWKEGNQYLYDCIYSATVRKVTEVPIKAADIDKFDLFAN